MKKSIVMLLALSLIITVFAYPVSAQEVGEDSSRVMFNPLRFTYISSTATSIGIKNGVVMAAASLDCHTNASNCYVVLFLRRRLIGTTSWSTVVSFSDYGIHSCGTGGSINAVHGYEYIVEARYTAYASDGRTETTYGYSVVKQYP